MQSVNEELETSKEESRLHEILPRSTEMPVVLISEGLDLQPNHVLSPPLRDLHVLDGEFRLKPISKPRGWPGVITVFLRSLTENWDGQLIAVIVSGYDGDGADALCAIKDVGGITIAQKPETAGQPDMPASAIASGCIDFVLSPERIAPRLYESRGVRFAAPLSPRAASGRASVAAVWCLFPLESAPVRTMATRLVIHGCKILRRSPTLDVAPRIHNCRSVRSTVSTPQP